MESSMQIELKNALEQGLIENDTFKDIDIISLSKNIEEDFLKIMSGKSSRIIRQRRFELMSNLKRPNNSDLRRRILAGEMTIRQFVTCPVSELAPDSVKQQRLEEQQRYFKEECILMTNDKDNNDISDKKRNNNFDDIINQINEYNNEQFIDLTNDSENNSIIRKNKKMKNEEKIQINIFSDFSLFLNNPPNYNHLTPKFTLNKYIEKYKDIIKNNRIQNELIKQAKLRIVTST